MPMKCSIALAPLLLCFWSVAVSASAQNADPMAATAAPTENPAYDRASFAVELNRLSGALEKKLSTNDMAALRDSLPRRWTVATPERTYSISSEQLRNELTSLSREKALFWTRRLAAEVQNNSLPPAQDPGNPRSELTQILARPEFAAVRPPSAWDLFKQRIAYWLYNLLLRLFSTIGRHPITGQILFWAVIIAAVGGIALLLFRLVSRRDRIDALQASTAVSVSRSWQEWIRAAHEAANRGDIRDAVHCAYWAGIVRLEEAGVVARDRTRTPREYLRSLGEPRSSDPPTRAASREPLAALTARLERIWYANRPPGPDDFADSLRQLEALGCRLE